jgi:hypothetical protein
MATITSNATGDWSTGGTWVGGVSPSDGDIAVIAANHIVTITTGNPVTIGTSGATGTAAVTVNSGTGGLVLNATLTLKGDLVLQKGANLTQNSGGNIEFRAPTGSRYRIYANTTGSGTGTWTVNGASGSKVDLTSNSVDGGSNGYVLIDEVSQTSCAWDHFNWQYIGDSGQDAINYTDWSTQSFRWTNGLILNCGRTNWGLNQAGSTLSLNNLDWREPLNNTFCRVLGNAALTTGTRQITECTASKVSTTIEMERWLRDLTMTNCVWRSVTFSDLNRRTIRVSNAFNLMERSGTGESFGQDNDCWITESGFISNFDNPHHISESTGTGAGVTNIYNYNIFDNFGVFTSDYGDNVIPRGVVDVKYNISINTGGVLVTIISSAPTVTIEHNTCYGSRGINVGEGADGSATIGNFRSNLFVSQNAGITQDANFVTKGSGFVMNYNGYYDMTTSSNVDYGGNNTYLGVATSTWKTGATYHDADFGANDVYGNPNFAAPTRTSATWDTANGGAGTFANIIAECLKLNGYAADGSAATFDTDYTIANYKTYIRAGFAPQNVLFDGTAHDGGSIGAVAYVAGGPTYTQSVSGGLTFTGTNVKTTLKTQAGALAFTGGMVRTPAKVLSGALTFSGATVKSAAKLLLGTLTFAGALSSLKSFVQAVGGSLSFSSGTVVKATSKTVAGALTFAGAAVKQTDKVLAGALSFAGSTIKATSKALAGVLTFVGALGAVLQSAYTYAQSVGGTLSFSSGILVKRASKIISGSLTATGETLKRTSKIMTGALSFSGSFSALKTIVRSVGGALSFSSGTVSKIPGKVLSGSISFSGAMLKVTSKVLLGSMTFSGVALKQTYKIIGGTLSFVGAVFIQAGRVAANLSRMVVAQTRIRVILADERMRKMIAWARVRFL